MTEKIRVLLVYSHPMTREGLRIALERSGLIQVVAEAEDGFAATLAAIAQRPDIVIIDGDIQTLECADTVKRLSALQLRPGILVSLAAVSPIDIDYLAHAGANGFVDAMAGAQEYIDAILAIQTGGSYFSESTASGDFESQARTERGIDTFRLTPREVEILRLICEGFSNKDIARRCELSVRTVEAHRFSIRRKTNAPRLRDLVQIGRQLEVVDQPTEEQHVLSYQTSIPSAKRAA
jgi:two-component system nitrate/nitrite response regulator NarL